MASKEIISDFLSGFFIILENQYLIGDEVKIAGIEGEVKNNLKENYYQRCGGFNSFNS